MECAEVMQAYEVKCQQQENEISDLKLKLQALDAQVKILTRIS